MHAGPGGEVEPVFPHLLGPGVIHLGHKGGCQDVAQPSTPACALAKRSGACNLSRRKIDRFPQCQAVGTPVGSSVRYSLGPPLPKASQAKLVLTKSQKPATKKHTNQPTPKSQNQRWYCFFLGSQCESGMTRHAGCCVRRAHPLVVVGQAGLLHVGGGADVGPLDAELAVAAPPQLPQLGRQDDKRLPCSQAASFRACAYQMPYRKEQATTPL